MYAHMYECGYVCLFFMLSPLYSLLPSGVIKVIIKQLGLISVSNVITHIFLMKKDE